MLYKVSLATLFLFSLCYGHQIRNSCYRSMSLMMNSKKVVITGIGSVNCLGNGAEMSYKAMCDGRSGIIALPSWANKFSSKIAGVVDFNPLDHKIQKKVISRNARYTLFALAASSEAIMDANICTDKVDKHRFGCIIGSSMGGVDWYERNAQRFYSEESSRSIEPMLLPAFISNSASAMVAIEYGAKGPCYGVTTACASGSHAIGSALKHLRSGDADIILAGGSDASLTPLCVGGFCSLTALAMKHQDTPTKASRPFDKNRTGFVIAEGAGVLVLETEEHALSRGAKIYCELAGHGATCDAYHVTSPSPDGSGIRKSMSTALRDGNIDLSEVNYISAHGTSTILNDKIETLAIKSLFGDYVNSLKVSSIKSMIGHSLGAAGAIESVVCALIFKHGVVPPTINLEDPDIDSGCDLDYVANRAQTLSRPPNVILSNSLGFGGHNSALAFRKYM